MKGKWQGIIGYWLPIAVLATTISLLIYITAQQLLRTSANDPQIQIAQDITTMLSEGKQVPYLGGQKVDMHKSLASFIMLFDDQKKAVASTAQLDGSVPTVPSGVFDYVLKHGEKRFTWQPTAEVRDAVVMKHYTGAHSGYVLVGRSLVETERRTNSLLFLTIAGWGVSMFLSLVACVFVTISQGWKRT